jgi:uncharacterized membrane protein
MTIRNSAIRAPDLGWKAFDGPPFPLLQGFVTLNAFIISTTVLIRQNRMSRLADHHAHLDLQVNLLTEEKTSKIIQLPADARAVLSAIEHEQDEPYEQSGTRARH